MTIFLIWTTITRISALIYGEDRVQVDPTNFEIIEAGDFVLRELKKLSDSGVYETLKLKKIVSAETQAGAYHNSIFIQMEFTSPHLEGGTSITSHNVVVMRNLNDDVLSFAIDEFPKMDEEAIEEFWIRKVERARKFREEEFARIEREEQDETAARHIEL